MLLREFFLLALAATPSLAGTIQPRSIALAEPSRDERPSWIRRVRDGLFGSFQETRPQQKNHLAHYIDDFVLRFKMDNEDDARALANATNRLYLDVWAATGRSMDVRLSRERLPELLSLLPDSLQLAHEPLIPNLVQSVLDSYPNDHRVPAPLATLPVSSQAENPFFQDYQPHAVIVQWMKLLELMFPSFVNVISVGTSYEGRDLTALRIGVPREGDTKKKTIIVNGGTHAREWISISTVCFMAYQMVTGYAQGDKSLDQMVEQFDWVFIPTLNPDSYVYTWEHDRLWRKNRQPTSLSFCKGVDLDRAYGFHFDDTLRSIANPCSDMFPGSQAFEAVEPREFVAWATNYTNSGEQIYGLLDLHSYSQQILYPYSFSCDVLPVDLENLTELGIGLATAIRLQSGERYEVASACEGNGFQAMGSGSMLDYFYAVKRVPHAFQIKLRDTGNYGFLLPKQNIIPTGEETFSLLKYYAQFLLDDGGPTVVKNEL